MIKAFEKSTVEETLEVIFHRICETDDQRLGLLYTIGICFFCGADVRKEQCHCMNDE